MHATDDHDAYGRTPAEIDALLARPDRGLALGRQPVPAVGPDEETAPAAPPTTPGHSVAVDLAALTTGERLRAAMQLRRMAGMFPDGSPAQLDLRATALRYASVGTIPGR